MIEVILTKGLPASGKSTWARGRLAEYPGRYKRVNKDELRSMLDAKHSKSNERFVLELRDEIILRAIAEGKHVIVDDTNLAPKHEARISALVHGKAKVSTEVFDVPLEECIRRDLARPNSVGEKVIRQMWRQFLAPQPASAAYMEGARHAILVDLDGTLALMRNRSPYDAARCEEDELSSVVEGIVRRYSEGGGAVVLMSGRQSEYRVQTERWLARHEITYEGLYMRATGDSRKDSIVKRELFDAHVREQFNVDFVLDDRNQVVDMWRNELGLVCLQVAEGDF